MITSVIRQRMFDGIRCTAMRREGCKYSIAYLCTDGKVWQSAASTIADARELIEKDEKIVKLVVYIYHPKKEMFEHIKTFERVCE